MKKKIFFAFAIIFCVVLLCTALMACNNDSEDVSDNGSETPGSETPGGETPGGETPGGETPGGETPGGETPGGETPTPPGNTEYWVNFDLNYDDIPAIQKQTVNGLIDYMPTRSGYTFNGWWYSESETASGHVLSRLHNMADKITQENVTLYADWILIVDKSDQIAAPVVSLIDDTFSWEAVPGAQGYHILVYSYEETAFIVDITVTDTEYVFPSDSECGTYYFSIVAKGDGINTYNSEAVKTEYEYKILADVAAFAFDQFTNILTWSAVPNAQNYEYELNGEEIAPTDFSFDFSEYQAGDYTFTVCAEAYGWQDSVSTFSFRKVRLATPKVTITSVVTDPLYVLSWANVFNADRYLVNLNGIRYTVTDNKLTIDCDNDSLWDSENNVRLTVDAFDSDAEYLISVNAEEIVLPRKYLFSVEKGIYGNYSVNSVPHKIAAKVSFDLNGASGTAPETQTVTKEVGLEYPAIPTRSGYVFAGWYDNEECSGTPYDFTAGISGDLTLYAKWISYAGNGVLPLNGNITVEVVPKNSATRHYYAFVPLVSGEITIYSGNGLNDTYGYLYDSDKNQLDFDDDDGEGNNFLITYNVTAGQLYYISPCGYSAAGTTTVYMTGAEMPADGDLAQENIINNYYFAYGESVNVVAAPYFEMGYSFAGWYEGETLLTTDPAYEFIMPAENKTLEIAWTAYTLSLDNDDPEGGDFSIIAFESIDRAEVSFDLNGASGTAPETQTVTKEVGLEYPAIPTRSGYVFAGWYDNEECSGTPYDFTAGISGDLTLYAKWVQMNTTGYSYTAIDIIGENNTAVNYYSTSLRGTSSSYRKDIYFTALNDGEYSLYYSNGNRSTSSYYNIYMEVKNVTQNTTIRSNSIFSNYSMKNLTFNAKAGDVIMVRVYRYYTNYSPTFRMYVTGGTMPADGGSIKTFVPAYSVNDEAYLVSAGCNAKIVAEADDGYTFLGWYDGETLLTTDLIYEFIMPAENKTFTAKWQSA